LYAASKATIRHASRATWQAAVAFDESTGNYLLKQKMLLSQVCKQHGLMLLAYIYVVAISKAATSPSNLRSAKRPSRRSGGAFFLWRRSRLSL
jgi:hypothetical protein